MKRCYC